MNPMIKNLILRAEILVINNAQKLYNLVDYKISLPYVKLVFKGNMTSEGSLDNNFKTE